jgi:hypothetical protein
MGTSAANSAERVSPQMPSRTLEAGLAMWKREAAGPW